MEDNSTGKKELIIIGAILAVILIVFVVKQVTKVELLTATGKANKSHENVLISNYEEFNEFVEQVGLQDTITVNYKKVSVSEKYNEEYFKEKKLAAVVVYEDTSKSYIYSIDNLEYTNNKQNATVTYTDKTDGYAGTLGNSWYNVMFVELNSSVTDVNFVKSADVEEK